MAIVVGQTTWQFPFKPEQCIIGSCALGSTAPCGGRIICKSLGIAWIVAPSSSQVSRTWYLRNDAVTTATACTTSTTWFIPTCAQLLNPGFSCRTYWDSYSSTVYWSSTENNSSLAWLVGLCPGGGSTSYGKTLTYCVRAFRCVTY